jgi:hypothetical protein
MTGDLLFNGMPATEDVRNSVAFVEQEDDYHLASDFLALTSFVTHYFVV